MEQDMIFHGMAFEKSLNTILLVPRNSVKRDGFNISAFCSPVSTNINAMMFCRLSVAELNTSGSLFLSLHIKWNISILTMIFLEGIL